MTAPPSCPVCSAVEMRPATLHFACPVCGERMREVVDPDLEAGAVLHCPRHCATVVPNEAMLEDARARAGGSAA